VVILGGEGKGQDFKPRTGMRYVRAVVLIGRDRSRCSAALPNEAGVVRWDAGSMLHAVTLAARQGLTATRC
jgi:UDP-N-acetylmuramoylalanine-D-glutamate ligase